MIMQKIIISIMILGSFVAKADLVKKDGYLRSIDKNGYMHYVKDASSLVKTNEVEVVSSNLVIKDGYLRSVDKDGYMHYVKDASGLVKANEISN